MNVKEIDDSTFSLTTPDGGITATLEIFGDSSLLIVESSPEVEQWFDNHGDYGLVGAGPDPVFGEDGELLPEYEWLQPLLERGDALVKGRGDQ